jgi:hypothetical protein
MRNRILGMIGVLWGGGILASAFLRDAPAGSDAYAAGHTAGLVLGGLLFLVGAYYLFKRAH